MLDAFSDSSVLMMVGIFPVGESGLSPNLRVGAGRKITASSAGSRVGELSHLDAGVRLVRKEIEGFFPEEEVFSLEDNLYPRLIAVDKLAAWPVEERFYDIGTPERVKIFENYLMSQP